MKKVPFVTKEQLDEIERTAAAKEADETQADPE